jgi:hypothetical protein
MISDANMSATKHIRKTASTFAFIRQLQLFLFALSVILLLLSGLLLLLGELLLSALDY